MNILDWGVIAVYIVMIVGAGAVLGRSTRYQDGRSGRRCSQFGALAVYRDFVALVESHRIRSHGFCDSSFIRMGQRPAQGSLFGLRRG